MDPVGFLRLLTDVPATQETLDLVGDTLAVFEHIANMKSLERLRCEEFEPGLDLLVSFAGAVVKEEDVLYAWALVGGRGYWLHQKMVELPGQAWMNLEEYGIAIW